MNIIDFYKIYRIYILPVVPGTTSETDHHILVIKYILTA